MPFWENQLDQWLSEKPQRTATSDFDAFWEETQSLALSQSLNAQVASVDYPSPKLSAYQVSFDAFGRGRFQAWLLAPSLPTAPPEKLPVLILWHDYLGFRGRICTHLSWALQGFVVLVPDIRGHGDSSDLTHYSWGNNKGYFPQGIQDAHEYYLRGCIADGLRAVQFLNERDDVDTERIGVIGQGLGGVVSLWVAAFSPQVKALGAVSPYPCDWSRHIGTASSIAASEVKTYLSRYPQQEERVLKTLSYFDPINIAHRIRCQSLFVLGLKDSTAPPQDSLGVYNRIEGEKGLKVFPYDGYGAGGDLGKEELVRWMQDRLMP